MIYRTLGRTGIRVSALAFGAGPVSGLMTGDDEAAQIATLQKAIDLGINWIDTAAGYGLGKSEFSIGRALRAIRSIDSRFVSDAPTHPSALPPKRGEREFELHIATKVRLELDQLNDIKGAIRRSVEASLGRLGVSSVTLLQLHNGLTANQSDEAYSITPSDVLRQNGVLDTFRDLRDEGLIHHLGLTGTGQPDAMREVVGSGGFDTIQVPYHLLNPSAGQIIPAEFRETNYGNIIADCAAMNMGVFAIRVFAAGALLGNEPSAHTHKTPFFPLDLYLRDRQRATQISQGKSLKETALKFVLNDARVHGAIIGFGAPEQVEELYGIVKAV